MKRILLITFLSIFIFKVYGQDNIGTPYSVYGIGLQTENVGPYNAMGGVAAAMRDNGNINYLNPASYTALDTARLHGRVCPLVYLQRKCKLPGGTKHGIQHSIPSP